MENITAVLGNLLGIDSKETPSMFKDKDGLDTLTINYVLDKAIAVEVVCNLFGTPIELHPVPINLIRYDVSEKSFWIKVETGIIEMNAYSKDNPSNAILFHRFEA